MSAPDEPDDDDDDVISLQWKKTNPDQESIFGIFYFTVPLNYGETIMIAIEHMIR